jgi:hypothetical protein
MKRREMGFDEDAVAKRRSRGAKNKYIREGEEKQGV